MAHRVMLVLAFLGFGIAAYLSYEHASAGTAFCLTGGSDCARVQNSPHLSPLGIYIPYVALGGYSVILGSLLGRAALVTALTAYAGALMTAYVFYLQAFVIKAWCPWCLISTAIMWTIAVLASREYIRGGPPPHPLVARPGRKRALHPLSR
jgi:uncharacterized membrane protein